MAETRTSMTGRRAVQLACALQALVVALGAGVAVARQSGNSPGRTGVTAASRPAAGGSNQARARQEASWLLSLTRLPDSAHETGRVHHLPGPVMGTPAVTSLVIRTSYWKVAMPYAATLAWVKAHPPEGLVQSGSAESGGPGGFTAGYGYSDRPSSSWADPNSRSRR